MTSTKYTKVPVPTGLVRELIKELKSRKVAEEFIVRKAMHGLIELQQRGGGI